MRVPSEKAHVYQIFQMLDALAAAGVDVTLAHPRRANIPQMQGEDPVTLYELRRKLAMRELPALDLVRTVTIDRPGLNRPPLPALAFALQSASFAASAACCVASTRARIIYSRDWPVLAATVPVRGGRRLIWEAHDLPANPAQRRVLRWLLPRLDGVVAISRGLRDALVDLGAPVCRLHVAPDAVNLVRFASSPSRHEARARLGLSRDAQIVVYTGHLYAWKGAHTLALASRELPDSAQVVIVGGTPADLQSFRGFVSSNQLDRVRVIGHVPPAEVPLWLAAADVVALPNSGKEVISARYTSPLKLYEYMAAERPIVASDLPSIGETLRHEETAVLVAPDDPSTLAAGIRRVLQDPDLAQRLAKRARAEVEGHTWDARARSIAAFVALAGTPTGMQR